MRLTYAVLVSLALVSLTVAGPAAAKGDSRESDTSQQGSAVGAMGRTGGGGKSKQSGIEIPNYGGDVSGIRRLPIGTTPPHSRSFVPAPRYFIRYR